jgi:hypothetical protein
MALIRLLWSQILHVAEQVPIVATSMVQFLSIDMAMTLPTINTSKKKKADNVDEDEAPSGADAMKILKKMRFAYPDWIALIDSYNVFVLWLRDIGMDASECDAVRSVDHNSSITKIAYIIR